MRSLLLVVSALFAVCLTISAASAQGYPVLCRGGGGMTAQMGSSGGASMVIDFRHAPQGYLEARPGRGECAWADRPMNSKEPTRLLLRDAASMGALLMNAIRGGYFSINAFTNGGLLEITSVNLGDDESDNAGGRQRPSEEPSFLPSNEPSFMPSQMPSMEDEQADMPSDELDFTGRWDSQTDAGDEFRIALEQDGKLVNGTYRADDGSRGTIKGAIKGGVLRFTWKIGKAHGTGEFELSGDGESFEGSYSTAGSDEEGVWSGNRR